MLGCSLGWWVAMDRGGAGTISQLFRTLTVDLFSHNPPISHYSLLTPLTPPLLLSLSFFLALSHTTSLSAPPPIGNVTQRGTWQKASNTLTEEDEHEENACLHKSRRAGCCIHTHIHTQWKRQTLHQHTQSDVRMLNLMQLNESGELQSQKFEMKEKAIQQEDLLLVTLENSPDSQHWWISAVWLPRPRWVLISQKALEAEVIFWLPRFFFFFFF